MEHHLALAVVCRVLGAPRSSVYARRAHAGAGGRPGPATSISDPDLLRLIRQVLASSPFAGEGYRKIRARLRREHAVRVSGKRVLRLLRREGLLAPQRVRGRRKPRLHDGTIIPDGPNLRWGTDATMAWTRSDGWVWVFACVDHYTAEAWAHVAKVGDRFAALQPVYDAVIDRWGRLDADIARGLSLRHDWGPQYRSAHFLGSIGWLGISDDATPRYATHSTRSPPSATAVELRCCGATHRRVRVRVGPAFPSHGRGPTALAPAAANVHDRRAGSSGAAFATARGHARHHASQHRLQCDAM
jgi:hypothetical protein